MEELVFYKREREKKEANFWYVVLNNNKMYILFFLHENKAFFIAFSEAIYQLISVYLRVLIKKFLSLN